MNLESLRTFFMWCTIINGALYVFTAMLCIFAREKVCRLQAMFFPLSKDTFTIVIYSYLALYKVCFIIFNLVPFVALTIMG